MLFGIIKYTKRLQENLIHKLREQSASLNETRSLTELEETCTIEDSGGS